jgi:hypothetical protein
MQLTKKVVKHADDGSLELVELVMRSVLKRRSNWIGWDTFHCLKREEKKIMELKKMGEQFGDRKEINTGDESYG